MSNYKSSTREGWGILWQSKNRLDGITEHLLIENCYPVLFRTRQEASKYRDEKYGYIRVREDLREEPHGWKLPKVIKLKIIFKAKK